MTPNHMPREMLTMMPSGQMIDLFNPMPHEIHIEDIAHALANQCRWNGTTSRYYSQAEHCFLVSQACPPHLQLEGLLHDAFGAYLGNLLDLVMNGVSLDVYDAMYRMMACAFADRFNAHGHPSEIVEALCHSVLAKELQELVPSLPPNVMPKGGFPTAIYQGDLFCWAPQKAKEMFLWQFGECAPQDLLERIAPQLLNTPIQLTEGSCRRSEP